MTSVAPWSRHKAKGLRQFRPIGLLAALDLDHLGNELPPAAVQIALDGRALRFQPKAGTDPAEQSRPLSTK